MVHIGRIQYANCTPIFHALQELYPAQGWRYVGGVPSRLNQQLLEGAIDVCPSSSIEFARHSDRYLIIPDLSISSCGAVQSVLLFSTLPLEKLHQQTILLSSESATSVNLLRILIRKRYGYDCSYQVTELDVERALQQAPAILLIGDAALRANGTAPVAPHVYDLGELWQDWTGTPFVFALWLVSRRAVAEKGDELARFAQCLLQARHHAEENLERIVDASPDAVWMGRERLLNYWRNHISYELTDRHVAGLQLFFKYLAELGLVERAPNPEFMRLDQANL